MSFRPPRQPTTTIQKFVVPKRRQKGLPDINLCLVAFKEYAELSWLDAQDKSKGNGNNNYGGRLIASRNRFEGWVTKLSASEDLEIKRYVQELAIFWETYLEHCKPCWSPKAEIGDYCFYQEKQSKKLVLDQIGKLVDIKVRWTSNLDELLVQWFDDGDADPKEFSKEELDARFDKLVNENKMPLIMQKHKKAKFATNHRKVAKTYTPKEGKSTESVPSDSSNNDPTEGTSMEKKPSVPLPARPSTSHERKLRLQKLKRAAAPTERPSKSATTKAGRKAAMEKAVSEAVTQIEKLSSIPSSAVAPPLKKKPRPTSNCHPTLANSLKKVPPTIASSSLKKAPTKIVHGDCHHAEKAPTIDSDRRPTVASSSLKKAPTTIVHDDCHHAEKAPTIDSDRRPTVTPPVEYRRKRDFEEERQYPSTTRSPGVEDVRVEPSLVTPSESSSKVRKVTFAADAPPTNLNTISEDATPEDAEMEAALASFNMKRMARQHKEQTNLQMYQLREEEKQKLGQAADYSKQAAGHQQKAAEHSRKASEYIKEGAAAASHQIQIAESSSDTVDGYIQDEEEMSAIRNNPKTPKKLRIRIDRMRIKNAAALQASCQNSSASYHHGRANAAGPCGTPIMETPTKTPNRELWPENPNE